MERGWSIDLWGVRGSAPLAEERFLTYGGNTSCLSVMQDACFVFDAGSGLPGLARQLPEKIRHICLFITHLHLDHLMGFPMIATAFPPDVTLDVYGPAGLADTLTALISPPLWPIGLNGVTAKLAFHQLTPGDTVETEGCTVRTMAGVHPGGSMYYRLQTPRGDLVYALDCELTEALRPALTAFCRGASVLVWDSHFTAEELRPGWGHSTWEQGAALARDADVQTVLMAHHSGAHDDAFLDALAAENAGGTPEIIFAKERMRLWL